MPVVVPLSRPGRSESSVDDLITYGMAAICLIALLVLPQPAPAQQAGPSGANVPDGRQLEQQQRLNDALKARIEALNHRLQMDECAILKRDGGSACLAPRPLIDFDSPVVEPGRQGSIAADQQSSGSTSSAAADPAPRETQATAMPRQQLVNWLERLTVFVLTRQATGSGFFVGPGLVLTNRHVIGDNTEILVTSKTLGRPYPVKIVNQSPTPRKVGFSDFALLQVVGLTGNPVARIGTRIDKLSGVIAAGYPGLVISADDALKALAAGDLTASPDLVLSRGEVSAIQRSGSTQNDSVETIVHTARIMSGNSGGPLVNACGQVIGINTFIAADAGEASSAGFALGQSAIRAFLSGTPGTVPAVAVDCTE